jgi:hypothetical protein
MNECTLLLPDTQYVATEEKLSIRPVEWLICQYKNQCWNILWYIILSVNKTGPQYNHPAPLNGKALTYLNSG